MTNDELIKSASILDILDDFNSISGGMSLSSTISNMGDLMKFLDEDHNNGDYAVYEGPDFHIKDFFNKFSKVVRNEETKEVEIRHGSYIVFDNGEFLIVESVLAPESQDFSIDN